MAFDWKDNLLVCGGMVAGVATVSVLSKALNLTPDADNEGVGALVVLFMVGPSGVRRAVFGNPSLPPPRASPVASLVSIGGLLATLAGMLLLLLTAVDLRKTLGAAPDFEAQARAKEAAESAMLAGLRPVPSAHEERVRQLEDQWKQDHGNGVERLFRIGGLGLLLVALGSLAAWWRYPRSAEVLSVVGRDAVTSKTSTPGSPPPGP